MRSVGGDKGTENIADNDNVTFVTSWIHVYYRPMPFWQEARQGNKTK
jgi:hypothetical protein